MKINHLVEFRWFNTYYYANIVFNVLQSRFEYLRNLHDFFENDAHLYFALPFQKRSILHHFIEHCVQSLVDEENDEETKQWMIRHKKTTLCHMFERYSIEHMTYKEWTDFTGIDPKANVLDNLYDYDSELRFNQSYDDLMKRISTEVFHILFANRSTLLLMNDLASGYISDQSVQEIAEDEYRDLFESDGVLKRKRPPEWAKRAVFHRDRGRCVYCNTDLSGILTLQDRKNFDHIVPLDKGGLNDVTNLQLTCSDCNSSKGVNSDTHSKYETWYDLDS